MNADKHKSGFVNIIGKPNVGKSTLMNKLVGEKLSIITSKAQTTRHRILGIVNGDDFQIVFSDSPGFITDPKYKLHESMNSFVRTSFIDADVVLFVREVGEKLNADEELINKLKAVEVPVFILLNKMDLSNIEEMKEKMAELEKAISPKEIIPISALHGENVDRVLNHILELIPVHPPYYPKDAMTDKPERFFVEEKIREKILTNYKQEIPYSVEVCVDSFKEDDDIIRIRAEIYVNRKSQKSIIIGKEGKAIKKVGTRARLDLERFFDKKIYLELFVKVKENWRDSDSTLRKFGYQ
jgi:GTP-binding protein Era